MELEFNIVAFKITLEINIMLDFEFIKNNYIKLVDAIIKYLDKFTEEAYYYKPTEKSNAVAWIVPHIAAFEKEKVMDFIENYTFDKVMSDENIVKYHPGVDGYKLKQNEMMTKEKAIEHLEAAKKASLKFLDDLINNAETTKDVDQDFVFARYMLSYSHTLEHYGQLKYLLGTYNRTH
jgi:hypothetical protein